MKILKKSVTILGVGLLGLALVIAATVAIGRTVNAARYKIRTDNGIQQTGYVPLGSIEQYVQIRGQDRTNPAIIVLHGGPGSTMAYYSYYWQTPLEEEYTIVHWDQRGAGNTYYQNLGNGEAPTLELLLTDLDELVDYVCAELNQDKVIILGHSWGSMLGGVYAGRHPEKLTRFIGAGQMASGWAAEDSAITEAVRLATEAGQAEAAEAMQARWQEMRAAPPINIADLMSLRAQTGAFLPTGDGMSIAAQMAMGIFSPYMTLRDLRWFLLPAMNMESFIQANQSLYDVLCAGGGFTMYDYPMEYDVPVSIIMGDSDWITPYGEALAYFDAITASGKSFHTVENAGHSPMLDKPEAFVAAVKGALSGT